MKKIPFVRQEGQMECGVACILMLIKYYNGYISTKQLSLMTKTTKNGTTVFNIVKALREIGFSADGVKCDFNLLLKENIKMPCICHVVINKSYNHFIVLYEISNNKFIIADPACGIKKLSYDKFKSIYNDIIIIAHPNKDIPKIRYEKNYNLFKIIKRNKSIIFVVIFYSLFITFLSIINSFYFGKLIDNLSYDSTSILFIVLLIFFFVKIIYLIFIFLKNKLNFLLGKRFDVELTNDIFSSILSLPYTNYTNYTTGDIFCRINDLSTIKDILSKIFVNLFSDIPIIICSLFLLFIINRFLTFFCLIIVIINIIVSLVFKKILSPLLIKLKNLKSADTSIMIDTINGYESVKGINIKDSIIQRINNRHIEYLNFNNCFFNLLNVRELCLRVVNDIGTILIQYLGIKLVSSDKITLSLLVTYNTIFSFLNSSLVSIIEFILQYNDFKASIVRVNDLMYKTKEKGFLNIFNKGGIKFKDFSFSFDDINYILKDINLSIKSREKLVVIGKSGSGKSTLFKALKGYYDIKYDSITINNIDINNYKKDVLNNNIVYISQNEILFNDSIINNIVYDNYSENKIMKICDICSISSIINKNNLGFNMIIEENGFNLSGGEKQRIVMARALLRDFDILIIDEALNQLDIYSERKMLINIFKYYSSKIIIFITHRLNNCDLFDHIIEIKEGMIVKDEYIKSR